MEPWCKLLTTPRAQIPGGGTRATKDCPWMLFCLVKHGGPLLSLVLRYCCIVKQEVPRPTLSNRFQRNSI
jgi:hypothetical protein